MSTFLGFDSYLLDIGTTVQGVQDALKSRLTGRTWRCLRQAINPIAVIGTIINPGNALDGNPITFAGDATALPLNVGVQMTSGFTPVYMYVQAHYAYSTWETDAPRTFTLDYSSDGSSWTTLQTWSTEINWLPSERRKYSVTGAGSHTYWRINITANNGDANYTYLGDWVLEDSTQNWITTSNFIDVIPPTGQTLGNAYARDILRVRVTSTTIDCFPLQELLTYLPQLYTFDTPIADAVTLSVTINGATVQYVGSSGNTAVKNARGLYEALKTSANANFTNWTWLWWNNTTSGSGMIAATRTTGADNILITSSNINTEIRGSYAKAIGVQGCGFPVPYSLPIDLNSGFVYYLQVSTRGIALGIKTSSGYYGPVHACYGDNTSTLAQLPVADIAQIPCTPIELIVGYDDVATTSGAFGRATHCWGIEGVPAGNPYVISSPDNGGNLCSSNVWTKQLAVGQLRDIPMNAVNLYGLSGFLITLSSEGIFTGTDINTSAFYGVHRLSCEYNHFYCSSFYGIALADSVTPAYSNLDWYRYIGAGGPTNEQLLIAPSADFSTTISAGSWTPADTTIHVASTTGFLAAGYIYTDGEIIQYTAKTSTTFTGCTRGKYNTMAISPMNGNSVYICSWYCAINTGLLFCGYTAPS